jgi:methanogenic corrinoid protein MtbC1
MESLESVMKDISEFEQIKHESKALPVISAQAKDLFHKAMPEILRLVNEKFRLQSQFEMEALDPEAMNFIQDAHRHLADLLLGIYENSLFEKLADEFRWYVSVFTSRGFKKDYFEKMLEAWIFAIHALIKPPESGELTRPLNWIVRRLPVFFESSKEEKPALTAEQERLLSLLLEKKRSKTWEFVQSFVEKEPSMERVYFDLLIPVLIRVGKLWERNEIGVADEHAATAIIRDLLSKIQSLRPPEKPVPYKALVSCVPGEEHDIGAEILADYLEIKGWTVYFIGHSTPEEDILKSLLELKPDVVFFSMTQISRINEARRIIQRVKEMLPEAKTILGGRGAIAARKALDDICDAVVGSILDGYKAAVEMVG